MKILPPINESPESKALFDSVAASTEILNYCEPHHDYPVHVHASKGDPDLSADAIHLFPEGFNEPTVDISDPDHGNDHFIICKGDMICRSLYTGSWLAVGGTLKATVIEGCSGCNRGVLATKIEATLILENGHSFEGEIVADTVYSAHEMVDPADGISSLSEDPTELFNAEFIQPVEGYEDEYELKDNLWAAVFAGENWKL